MSRPVLAVLCGGRSAERRVSLVSARFAAASAGRRRVRVVHLSAAGAWSEVSPARLEAARPEALLGGGAAERELLRGARRLDPWRFLTSLSPRDCVFPVLHGPYGEDGCLQGMLEMAGTAYVGCGVLGSAAGMDKEATKRLAERAGLPQLPWAAARSPAEAAAAARRLGWPVFVKPARMGSSVGVSKARGPRELLAGARRALRYDDKLVVEKGVPVRELECAVLGDPWAPAFDPLSARASEVGEIAPRSGFYDYRAKYLDPDGARLLAPAPIPPALRRAVRETALAAFRALDLYGLARMDFFVHARTGRLYFNEPNTLPGFTPVSMYPRLWKESGVGAEALVDALVRLAQRRAASRRALRLAP